ncbi:MAG: zinc-ribbon domain-containing transport protein [Candidatus Eremiobacteraeota bacterium]|nr:zinc-ribbon domain-containing transport protein [Candidatus Eremiobacteraeota bacterium]MBC5827366.1 zinc-ribbon domain-containing transport protein [Candidatus Eremiobacteraeota bacterium]
MHAPARPESDGGDFKPMAEQARVQLAAVSKSDPNFSEIDFLRRAAQVYSETLAAEGAMQVAAVQASVTPAFLLRLQARFGHWRDSGETRILTDLVCDSPLILKAVVGDKNESLTVRFTGSAVRYTKDDDSGVAVEGSVDPISFCEFATFIRPADSLTPDSPATGMANVCPSCGAPLGEGEPTCGFCGAASRRLGGTWLLDRISESAYT